MQYYEEARRLYAYSCWNLVYETTRNPDDRRDAAARLIGIRELLGMSHTEIMQKLKEKCI